jgi:hypothetical protein
VSRGNDLVHQAKQLQGKAISLLLQAKRAGDFRTALAGVREAANLLGLQARLLGDIAPDTTTVNITVNAQFVQVQATILQALERHPAARADVIAALETMQ